jgi:hypothetical protein
MEAEWEREIKNIREGVAQSNIFIYLRFGDYNRPQEIIKKQLENGTLNLKI